SWPPRPAPGRRWSCSRGRCRPPGPPCPPPLMQNSPQNLFYPLLHKEMTRRFQGLYSKRETENGGYDKMLHYLFSQYLTDKFYFLGLLAPLEKIFSIGEEPIRHILKDVKADLQGVFKYFHTISPKIVNHLNFSYLRKTL
ncbi:MAG: hypothetical protein PWR32_794, partial [Candidatus Woesearchaeota archaeon]|nr:hypothetical protein [Candidatus Woesearchaeota archaeon]